MIAGLQIISCFIHYCYIALWNHYESISCR